MFRFLLFLLFTSSLLSMHAQKDELSPRLNITHIVIQDAYTRKQISDANICFFKEDSVTLLTDEVSYSQSSSNGVVKHTPGNATFDYCTKFVVKISKEGYETATLAFNVPEKEIKTNGGQRYWDKMPQILLTRSIKTKQLGEAQVTASRLLMVMKGDTLEYNVANMQLSAGSMLDNLIKNLPGAQLDHNGRISINGEFVERMLVNGRNFFNGDSLVALKNLPNYTVGKIKVFHSIGSDFNNKADSLKSLSKSKLTMDVRLKKIYSEMWLVNVEAGMGTRTHTNWNNVYFGRFFAMRFTDHSSIGIYGLTNNVGKNYTATHNGNWREMQAATGGEPVTHSGGVDFSVDGKRSLLKFQTSLNVSHETTDAENCTSSQNFLESGDWFSRSRSQQHSKAFNARWTASLSRDTKKISFSIAPNISYEQNSNYGNFLNASFDGDPSDATRTASLDSLWGTNTSNRLEALRISKSRGMSKGENSFFFSSVRGGMNIKMPHTKDKLSILLSTRYWRSTYKSISYQQVTSRSSTYNENSFDSNPEHRFNYSAKVSYPFFYISGKNGFNMSGKLSYEFTHEYNYREQGIYKDDADQPATLPNMNTGYAWEYDLRNSFFTDVYDNKHTAAWNLNMNIPGLRKNNIINLSLYLPFNADQYKVEDTRGGQNQNKKKTFCNFTPSINLSALNYELSAGYNIQTYLPNISEMLDYTNEPMPLYRILGNPNLKTQYTHNFNLLWNHRVRERARWGGLSWEHAIINNKQTMARTINRQTGVTTSQRMNINGNWWSTGKAWFGSALDEAKHFNMSVATYYTYAHSVDFSSDNDAETPQRFTVYNHRTGGNASISYSYKERRVELSGNVAWTGLHSPAASFRKMSYTDMFYKLSFNTPLFGRLDFDTDIKLNMRRGYHEASMNTTEWIWNAALSTKFGRTGQWVVRAVAFDILHNLSNVTNTIDAQGHTETWNNCVQSYASLHLIYNLKVKPTKKGIGKAEGY